MDHSPNARTLLGKALEHLDYSDLVNFFNAPRNEGPHLEFKSYVGSSKDPKAHLNDVLKGICAMMNSEGGVVIWGAPDKSYTEGNKEPIFQGALTHVKMDLEPDQFNRMVLDRIDPLPPAVRFRKLAHDHHRVYVFEVSRSRFGPHQLSGTYWVRMGPESRYAPHYMVEALMARAEIPNLGVYVKITSVELDKSNYLINGTLYVANHSQLRNELDVSIYMQCHQGNFRRWPTDQAGNWDYSNNDTVIWIKNDIPVLHSHLIHEDQFRIDLPFTKMAYVHLTVSAGGRFAPLKTSQYRVDIEFSDPLIHGLKILGENDLPDKFDKSFRKRLERALGREV